MAVRAGRIFRVVGTTLAGLVVAAAAMVVAQPAQAATSPCTTRTTTTPFTAWGDANAYFTVPDGTFESGAPSWTKSTGVATVSGNEPWKVLGSGHATSLKLPAGGSAATPAMCIATAEDSLRLFYKSPGVSGSLLHVSIYVTSGVNVATNDYDISGSTAGWAVSQRIMLPDIRDASGRQTVTITFSQRQTTATWQIDDIEIDPWKTL
jgi:hypothetical protein